MQTHTTTPLSTPQIAKPRGVFGLVAGVATSDGAGVKLTRVLTQELQHRLDPYLMLDHFHSNDPGDYIAGFPDHPHRGFETITYMVAGRMRHRDSAGHEGLLENGGVQWMTAGRGVIHSEIPQQEDGLMSGFQLWLNLPASEKMREPWYRDFVAAELPRFTTEEGVDATVIAGASHGVAGAVTREHTQPLYLDLHMPQGARFAQDIPASHNAFLYVHEGEVQVGDRSVPAGRMAILDNAPDADGVVLHASQAARILLISGQPLKEPIVQYGPFVMNTQQQIYEALADFRAGRFGEEPAATTG